MRIDSQSQNFQTKNLFGCSNLRKDGKRKGENDFLGCLVTRENRRDFGRAKAFSFRAH